MNINHYVEANLNSDTGKQHDDPVTPEHKALTAQNVNVIIILKRNTTFGPNAYVYGYILVPASEIKCAKFNERK